MFAFKIVIFYFALSNILESIEGLIKLPAVEDNEIKKTEAVIRATTNKLFSALKLKGARNKTSVSRLALVHNYLVTLTLRDYHSLKEIAKLTRVDKSNINHETQSFIVLLNDIINEGTENTAVDTGSADVDEVVNFIDDYTKRLDLLINYHDAYNLKVDQPTKFIKRLKEIWNIPDDALADDSESSDDDDVILKEIEVWDDLDLETDTRRIFRGKRTKIKKFPFMASVEILGKFTCAGSIIEDDLVITAASCLQLAWNNRFYRENPAFLSVRVGSDFYEGGGDKIEVLEIYFHPSYDPKLLLNNIAVMRLVRKINFHRKSKRVKKIKIDTNAFTLPVTTEGITIVGWGAKGIDNIVHNAWENKLSFAILDIYPLEDCQDIYSKKYVTKKHFCGGFITKGYGACNRDVGGPGIVDGYLTGIISFGSPVCGRPDTPTVFVKVGYYADWIEEIMEMEVPHSRKRTTVRSSPLYSFATNFHTIRPSKKVTFGSITPLISNPLASLISQTTPVDKTLVKEFLKTMFSSGEIEEYLDIMRRPTPSESTTDMLRTSTSVTTISTTSTSEAPVTIRYTAHTQMVEESTSTPKDSVEDTDKEENDTEEADDSEIILEINETTTKPEDLESTKIESKDLKSLKQDDKIFIVEPWKMPTKYSESKETTTPTVETKPTPFENVSKQSSVEMIDDVILGLLLNDKNILADKTVVHDDSKDGKREPVLGSKTGKVVGLEPLVMNNYNEPSTLDKTDKIDKIIEMDKLDETDKRDTPYKDLTYRNQNNKAIGNIKKKRAKEIADGLISDKTLFKILVEYLAGNKKLKKI